MTSRWEFPIRFKLLALMTVLVVASTAAYLALAIKLFTEDKVSLVYELNASTVKTLAAETQAYLTKITDKVRLLTQGHQDAEWVKAVFEAEPDLVAYTLYRPTDHADRWDPVFTVRNSQFLKMYGADAQAIDQIRTQAPIPFGRVLSEHSWAQNSTLPGGAPILTLALDLNVSGVENVAVADVRLDKILQLLSEKGAVTAYLVNSLGEVIAHPNAEFVTSRAKLSEIPIVEEAVQSPVAFQLKPFEWQGKHWLGAYASVGVGGLHVISQVEESQAFAAARRFVQKSILFALVIITAAALISRWVSRGMTNSLQRLVEATEKVARWEEAPIFVRSHDEIGRLARAFNLMSNDLRNQRKQIEAHREDLERKVKERTAELVQQKKQVSEAQDALIRTTRLASLGELAGAAAHEVLNPLNNINIRAERVRDQATGPEASDATLLNEITGAWKKSYASGGWGTFETEVKKPSQDKVKTLFEEDLENLAAIAGDVSKRQNERKEDMEFVMGEITRVAKIINKMRALSRVGGERRPLDVHLAIDETALALSDIFEKKKISVVKDFSADPRDRFTLVADKDELVQVFSNLIRNSIQAIESAGRRAGEIRVSTRRNGKKIEVRVTDNGGGIAQAHLAKIFEANFTTKSLAEGTGLGLSISRRLVRAFGGDIEIEKTVEGDGTTFLIWFPGANA